MKRFALCILLAFPAFVWAATGTLSDNGDTTMVCKVRPHIHVSSGGGNGFGGGTIKFYFLDDNNAPRELEGASFQAPGPYDKTLDFERSVCVYGTLSGATSPTLVWVIH